MRKEVLRKLYLNLLYPEIVKEIINELREYAENYVISKCKEKYRNLLMTGPF
jgi:transcriptional accessory protein Tex/SPT6